MPGSFRWVRATPIPHGPFGDCPSDSFEHPIAVLSLPRSPRRRDLPLSCLVDTHWSCALGQAARDRPVTRQTRPIMPARPQTRRAGAGSREQGLWVPQAPQKGIRTTWGTCPFHWLVRGDVWMRPQGSLSSLWRLPRSRSTDSSPQPEKRPKVLDGDRHSMMAGTTAAMQLFPRCLRSTASRGTGTGRRRVGPSPDEAIRTLMHLYRTLMHMPLVLVRTL